MKSTLLYSLILICCAQPALAQLESDEQWQQQAAKQIQMQSANRTKQPANSKPNMQVQQAAKRQKIGGYPVPARHNSYGGYGYRTTRGSVRSGYGWRPQRAQLMPQGYSQEQLQQKIQRLQQMQQLMGGGMPQGQQQQKPNILQMLMGGGAQPQQQQSGQGGQMNRGELMKSFFGGDGSTSEETGQ